MFRLVAILSVFSVTGFLALQVEGSQEENPSSPEVSKKRNDASKAYEDIRLQRLYVKVFKRLGTMTVSLPKREPPASESSPADSEDRYAVSQDKSSKPKRKPSRPKERQETDWFIVGTAAVDSVTSHADVRFHAVENQEDTTKMIVDYIFNSSGQDYLRWHVFYRASDSKDANQILAELRQEYDQMVSYRQELMKRYKAVSIRRL